SPHFVSCVLGAGLLLGAGTEAQRNEWLPKIASGDAIVSVAWLEPERSATAAGVATRADGGRLTGEKIMVPFATAANGLIVLARTGEAADAIGLFLVDPAGPGVTVRRTATLASDAAYQVTLDGAPSAALGDPSRGWATFD